MYMGTAAISNGDFIHHAIDHSDLIILVGHDVRPCTQTDLLNCIQPAT